MELVVSRWDCPSGVTASDRTGVKAFLGWVELVGNGFTSCYSQYRSGWMLLQVTCKRCRSTAPGRLRALGCVNACTLNLHNIAAWRVLTYVLDDACGY